MPGLPERAVEVNEPHGLGSPLLVALNQLQRSRPMPLEWRPAAVTNLSQDPEDTLSKARARNMYSSLSVIFCL